MESGLNDSREARAARNQAMFRAVNERLKDLNQAFSAIVGTYSITCECADTECVEPVEVTPDEYAAVRHEANQFMVLPGHVYPDVEKVVKEVDAYAVVAKEGLAGEIAVADAAGE